MTYRVRDVGIDPAVAVPAATPIEKAETRLLEAETSQIFVTAHQQAWVGVVPASEFLKYRLMGGDLTDPVSCLQTPISYFATLDSPLLQVATLMRENWHERLPVLEEGRLLGVISRNQLLRFLGASLETLQSRELGERAEVPRPKFLVASQSGVKL